MGPGVLGHDQHRHLRPRPGRPSSRARRPAVRLLEGALPAAAGARPPDVRPRVRRLLAGHREPRSVPAGELRRPGQRDHARRPGHSAARQHLDRRGRGDRRPRRCRGPGVRRQLLRASRPRRRSAPTRCWARTCGFASAPASCRSVIDQSTFIGRSASVEGAIIGKSCDLRSHVHVHDGAALGDGVVARGANGRHARRAHLPAQGGRVGGASCTRASSGRRSDRRTYSAAKGCPASSTST